MTTRADPQPAATNGAERDRGAADPTEDGAGVARARAQVDANAALAPALRSMIEAVERTAAHVVATGPKRRTPRHAEQAPATKEEDPAEAVHDFRVSLRRLRTVLRALRRAYGRRKLRAIGAGLKRYGDATSVLRDEEVLRETLSGLSLPSEVRVRVDAWLGRRARQERAGRSRVVRLLSADLYEGGGLARELSRLGKVLRKGTKKRRSLDEVAHDAVVRAHRDLNLAVDAHGTVDTALVDASDALAMHALRIRFKRLRYTAELLGPLLEASVPQPSAEWPALIAPADLAGRAKGATRMQKRLGELHDVDEALVRIGRAWGLDGEARGAVITALRAERARLAARALAELSRWVVPRVR